HRGRTGPELERDRPGDFHIFGKWLGGIDKYVVAVFSSALVARARLVVRRVAAQRAPDRGHGVCRIVREFVGRLFFWRREGKAAVPAQRIGRTARVQVVAREFIFRRRPIRFLMVLILSHDKNAHGYGGKLVLYALEKI